MRRPNAVIIRQAWVEGRRHYRFGRLACDNQCTYATHHPFSLQKEWELRMRHWIPQCAQSLKMFAIAF